MATVRDVALAAGVSVGTASRALTGNGYVADETRLLVREAAARLGYVQKERARPAASSKTVGVVLPDITLPFYGTFLKFAEVELAALGYKTVVCNTVGVQGRVAFALDLLEKHELDGLIFNADATPADVARMEKLPVVSFERLLGAKIPMVASDHVAGGRLVGEALLAAGARNVLILTATHANPLFGDRRIAECRRVLEEGGAAATVAEIPDALFSFRYGRKLAAEYLSLYNQIDGVFTDDVAAYCCLAEAELAGRSVPRDLKIVGYDGNEIGEIISPPLTTVFQNVPLLAHTCVELLLKRITREPVDAETLVPVQFRRGATV